MSFDKLDRFKKNVKPVRKSSPLDGGTEESNDTNANIPQKQSRTQLAIANVAKPTEEEDPFAETDSEKNIIIWNKAEMQKHLGTDVVPEESDSIPQIKGASLVKLVERVTFEKYADTNFQRDFMYTYRSFTTPKELLELLIKRYNMQVPKGLSYGELQEWKQNKQRPIRLRVINVLKHWLENYWRDFTNDAEMGTKLHEFLMSDVMNSGNQTSAEQLSKLFNKKKEDPNSDRQVIFSKEPPKPILLPTKKSSASLALLDFSSEEIARQLTLIEYNLYKSIKPWEFFNQSWTKKDKEILSPNILNMIKRFNRASGWVATEIVKTEKLKDRTAALSKFIEVAEKCRTYNNFNALMEILSGLQSSSIFRLRQTWDGLGTKQIQTYEELKDLMTRQGNFKLRKHVKTCNPPLIPYLGVYLTDLTFIEDGNPDRLEGGLINWVKRQRYAAVLKDIQQYQQTPYCLEEVPFIQEYLLRYEPLDEDQCYKLSLMRETRQPEKETKEKRKSIFAAKKEPSKTALAPTKNAQPAQQKAAEEEEDEDEFEIEYRPGYKFYDKDSENNIIIEKSEDKDTIIAGTVAKLIERLTYEKYPDTAYVTAFLNTFRTFISPAEFLELLVMRYHIPPPVNASESGVMEKFKMKKETPIQLRVFNVCKLWVDKHFEDFREDKQLLTKLLEFVDKSMVNGKEQGMQRAGQNLKAQISNKLDIKEVKLEYIFDHKPPAPFLPTVANPTLLDFSAEELARQFTLIDFEYMTAIKGVEFLHLNKSSASFFEEEQQEEDPETVKNSPHIVAVMYRFTDIRDWVATEIMKREDKASRAKVIEHFINVAEHCMTLKNFQTLQSILVSLNFEFIQKLKSTWKLVSPSAAGSFVQMSELISYRENYKMLRDKLNTLDYPCIPYIGMYLQDLVATREQMPDTIEPGSFVNFAKRFKLSQIISEITNYNQQPFCLEPVSTIQEYLKALDIYEISEMKAISTQFQTTDGDDKIAGSIFEQIMARNEALAKGQPVPEIKLPPPTSNASKTPPDSSPRNSNNPDAPSANPTTTTNSSPRDSPRSSRYL